MNENQKPKNERRKFLGIKQPENGKIKRGEITVTIFIKLTCNEMPELSSLSISPLPARA
jgi:hypothetical protein